MNTQLFRIHKMITKGKCFDLLTNSLHQFYKICMEISLKNLPGDIEA